MGTQRRFVKVRLYLFATCMFPDSYAAARVLRQAGHRHLVMGAPRDELPEYIGTVEFFGIVIISIAETVEICEDTVR